MHSASATLTINEDALRTKHADALRGLLDGEVRFDAHDRMLYATDASIYQVEPLGVVVPAHTEDIARTLRYAHEQALPVLPRGGGTSLAGQCVNHAIVIDVSAHCTNIVKIDPDARTAAVESGVTIAALNEHAKAHGLFFAPDPSTWRQCNIGGCIGNNAAGTRSILYGRTAENLVSVDALLPDATRVTLAAGSCARDERLRPIGTRIVELVRMHRDDIRTRFSKTLRRNAGYALDMMLDQVETAERDAVNPLERLNLAHLVCGSEGTLAFITRATVDLHPIPNAKGLAVLGFDSLDAAIAAVEPLLELRPSAVELLDDLVIGLARTNTALAHDVELMPQPARGPLEAVLYVEFFGNSRQAVQNGFDGVASVLASLKGGDAAGLASYHDQASIDRALRLRQAGEPLLHAIPGARKPLGFIEDNVVPVERLGEFVTRLRDVIESRGTRAAFYAHASVGVLHVRPLLSLRSDADRAYMEAIATEAADLARELGGVMSGEHGDGRARGPFLERHFGPELMRVFREVKALFDPDGLLNPGNIVEPLDVPSIHESTRVRPHGANAEYPGVRTYFDYSAEEGFDHAVELCNGAGVCRKTTGGTMCPSYRATLDERHATRGRGNALRLAISGQLPGGEAWSDADTLETLRLCLSCKACKTECPSNVDIAQYKAEYLAQSYRHSGRTPLQAIAFGRVRALNRVGSLFAPISNAIAESSPVRALTNRALGLSPKRSLPPFARSLFARVRSMSPAMNGGLSEDAPHVVLFSDCFTTYNEPEIGLASIRLLNAFGYRVILKDTGCCARTHISTGLLAEAIDEIASCAGRLDKAARDAAAILVCEPSCLSTIRDEWLKLGANMNPTERTRLAGRSFLVEQFLHDAWDRHPRTPEFQKPTGRVVLHGHCHQKALWGSDTSANILVRAFGVDRVVALDTGCCGMAGSFGYTADRYDLSMRIGEESLFPSVRTLGDDDVVVAPGTSCRHQIHDGTQRTAVHPIVLLDSARRSDATQRVDQD